MIRKILVHSRISTTSDSKKKQPSFSDDKDNQDLYATKMEIWSYFAYNRCKFSHLTSHANESTKGFQ